MYDKGRNRLTDYRQGIRYESVRTAEYDEDSESRFRRQNKNLDVLESSVSRLGELSLTISKEIDVQNLLLTNLESEVDKAEASSNSIVKKTRELVEKTGGTMNFCVILTLTLILVILILLVIYT